MEETTLFPDRDGIDERTLIGPPMTISFNVFVWLERLVASIGCRLGRVHQVRRQAGGGVEFAGEGFSVSADLPDGDPFTAASQAFLKGFQAQFNAPPSMFSALRSMR